MSAKDYLPEGKYLDLENGQRVHVLDQGEGPVVLFLHGSGSGASGHSNFKGNYPYFAANGFRVLVPDLVGYGFSDKPENVDYHLDFFVECIKQMLDQLQVSSCLVIGNSLGGAIAIKMTLDYPALVDKLLLMAPGGIEEQPAYFEMPGMATMKEVFMSPDPVTPERLRHFISTALVYKQEVVTDELVMERWEVMQTQNQQVIKTMVVPNMENRLGELKCPKMVMWGLNENMMPPTGIEKLAKNCTNVRLVLVSECGHWVMVEHQDMFNRTCLDFFRHG